MISYFIYTTKELQIPKKFKNQYSSGEIYNFVTGGVPRHISLLATATESTVTDWAEEMVNKTVQNVKATCAQLDSQDKGDFITFLGSLLTGQKSKPSSPVWYDKGLLFKSPTQGLQVISPVVRAGLWEYYVRSLGIEIVNAPAQVNNSVLNN